MGVYVHELNLMLTEKCNLACSHCMRGNATNCNMSKVVLDSIFSNITTIDLLNITGGEPLLDLNQLRLLIGSIREHNTNIDSFDIITNGTQCSKELIKLLIELDNLCVHDLRYSHILVSTDKYHNSEIERLKLSDKRNKTIETFTELDKNYGLMFSTYNEADNRLLPIGRGKNLVDGNNQKSILVRHYLEEYLRTGDISLIGNIIPVRHNWYKKYLNYNGNITININGDVCLLIDISFNESHRYRIGNLLESDLITILDNKVLEENNNYKFKTKGIY